MNVTIRNERPEDAPAIRILAERAFGQPQEALLIEELRRNNAVLSSLVAEDEGAILGHVLYSPVRVGELEGAGLGPMAVLPGRQKRGIGSKLVEEGTERLRDRGCPFIVVLGHPEYYPRFGFVPASRYGLRCKWDVPDEVFMVLPLDEGRLRSQAGLVRYREEFDRA